MRWLALLSSLLLLGASECAATGEGCEPSDGQASFDIAAADLADYGVDDPSAIDEKTCVWICEDSSGLIDVTTCEAEDAGGGDARIYCEGLYEC
jgi:hypothetical protein